MAGARGAGHVELSEGTFVFGKFPLVEEAEGAHAEGEDWGNGRGGGEERGCTENGAIAAESGSEVDF